MKRGFSNKPYPEVEEIAVSEESPLVFRRPTISVSSSSESLIPTQLDPDSDKEPIDENEMEKRGLVWTDFAQDDDGDDEEEESESSTVLESSSSSLPSLKRPKIVETTAVQTKQKLVESSVQTKPKFVENTNKVQTNEFENLEAEIQKILYQAKENNYYYLSQTMRDQYPFFLVALANVSRKLVENNSPVFLDNKLAKRFLNDGSLAVFKELVLGQLTNSQYNAVVSCLPDDLLNSRYIGSRGFILSVLRGIPVSPENLNMKRKRLQTLDWKKLNLKLDVSEIGEDQTRWKYRVLFPQTTQSVNNDSSEILQILIPLFQKERKQKDFVEYVAEYEANPKMYEELLREQEKRDFEREAKMERYQKRYKPKDKQEYDEEDDKYEGKQGMDLIDLIVGKSNSAKSYPQREESSLSSNSLFSSDDEQMFDDNEKAAANERADEYMGAQPMDFEEEYVQDEVATFSKEHDEKMFARIGLITAVISRNDAKKELTNASSDEITNRAEEIWANYMLKPNLIFPLSNIFYDEKQFANVEGLSVSEVLKGKTNNTK